MEALKVHFVRHAESQLNEAALKVRERVQGDLWTHPDHKEIKFGTQYLDVSITEKGKAVSRQGQKIVNQIPFDLVIVSPMRRALQTCHLMFETHPMKPKVIVLPDFREILQSFCDIGCKVRESMALFPDFNFSAIQDPDFWWVDTVPDKEARQLLLSELKKAQQNPTQPYPPPVAATMAFIRHFYYVRCDLAARDDPKIIQAVLPSKEKQLKIMRQYASQGKRVAVVSHSRNIQNFTGKHLDNCEVYEYTLE